MKALALSGLLGLGIAFISASGAATPPVPLTLVINGSGWVKVTDKARVECKKACKQTLLLKAGSKVAVIAKPTLAEPGVSWKLAPWTGACSGVGKCEVTMTSPSKVIVTFIAPGEQANPIPLRHSWDVREGWALTVNSVALNADAQVVASNPSGATLAQVPAGAQDVLISILAGYKGGGSGGVELGLVGFIETVGAHKTIYDTNTNPCPGSFWPSPMLGATKDEQQVFSGQSVTGNICYEIAANDASTLQMFVYDGENDSQKVWFALS